MASLKDQEEKWIYGYKGFYPGLVNQFGEQYEIGKLYVDPNACKNMGFYFCKNIEDIFMFPGYRKDVEVYQVCGGGKVIPYWNDYYGIYDVYATEKLKIIREVSREEIIQYYLSFSDVFLDRRILRFISLYPLNEDEILLFKERFSGVSQVLDYIAFYQEGDEQVFARRFEKNNI